jgi:hypothetical protein
MGTISGSLPSSLPSPSLPSSDTPPPGSVDLSWGKDGPEAKVTVPPSVLYSLSTQGLALMTGAISWATLPAVLVVGTVAYGIGKCVDRRYAGLSVAAMDQIDERFEGLQPGTERCRQLAAAIQVDLTAKTSLLDRPSGFGVEPGMRFQQRERDLGTLRRKDVAILRNLETLVPLHKEQMGLTKDLQGEMASSRDAIKKQFLGGIFKVI